jgi:hypothetical protein
MKEELGKRREARAQEAKRQPSGKREEVGSK